MNCTYKDVHFSFLSSIHFDSLFLRFFLKRIRHAIVCAYIECLCAQFGETALVIAQQHGEAGIARLLSVRILYIASVFI